MKPKAKVLFLFPKNDYPKSTTIQVQIRISCTDPEVSNKDIRITAVVHTLLDKKEAYAAKAMDQKLNLSLGNVVEFEILPFKQNESVELKSRHILEVCVSIDGRLIGHGLSPQFICCEEIFSPSRDKPTGENSNCPVLCSSMTNKSAEAESKTDVDDLETLQSSYFALGQMLIQKLEKKYNVSNSI